MLEVDALGSVGKDLNLSFSVIIALLEICKSCGCLTFEAEGGADFGPVDLEGCASLLGEREGQ